MNYLKRFSGSKTQIDEHLPIAVSDAYLEDQKSEREWYRTMREATAKVPILEKEIKRLKKERKDWMSQRTNMEQDHKMFGIANKNLQTKADEAERRWMDLKKFAERLETDNSELRKRLQEEEIQVKELRLRFGFDLSRMSKSSTPRSRCSSSPMATAPGPDSNESFMRRVQMAKKRLSINVNEKLGGRGKVPEKVVSLALLNERTESFQQAVLALQREIEELQNKNEGLVVAFKESKILNDGLKQTNEDMEQQVKDLRGVLKKLSSPRRSPTGELKESWDQPIFKQGSHEDLHHILSGIEVQRNEIVQEKPISNSEVDKLRESVKSLENDLSNSRSTVKSLRSDLETANEKINRQNAEAAEMRKRLGELEIKDQISIDQMKGLENQLELTQGELKIMKGLVTRLEQEKQQQEDERKKSLVKLESDL